MLGMIKYHIIFNEIFLVAFVKTLVQWHEI